MFNDWFGSPGGGDSPKTDTGYVIREYKQCASFVQMNWTDDLGKQFAHLLQGVEMDLTKLEHRKVALSVEMAELRKKLQDLANDDDPPSTYGFGSKKLPWSTDDDQFRAGNSSH